MKKIKEFIKGEKGNVLMIFAASFILISFFIGLIIDVGMIYMENNSMQNLLQIIREERFTHQESIRYSDNPAKETYELAHQSAKKNGFTGNIKLYFQEDALPRDTSFRSYKIRIILEDKGHFYFGKLFGLTTIDLAATLDGGESYGDGLMDVVWFPPEGAANYNGLYSGDMESASDDYVYVPSDDDPPGGW